MPLGPAAALYISLLQQRFTLVHGFLYQVGTSTVNYFSCPMFCLLLCLFVFQFSLENISEQGLFFFGAHFFWHGANQLYFLVCCLEQELCPPNK